MWTTETLIRCWWVCKMVHVLWETVVSYKTNILLPCDLAITILGIYLLKGVEMYVHTKPCTQIFIVLFVIAET